MSESVALTFVGVAEAWEGRKVMIVATDVSKWPIHKNFLFAKNSNIGRMFCFSSEGQKRCEVCRENHFQRVKTLDLIFIRWREKKRTKYLAFWQTAKSEQTSPVFLSLTHTPHSLTNTLTYRFSTCLGPSWGLPACIAMGDWQRVSTRGEVRLRLSELTSHESLKRLCFHLHLSERVIPCCDSSTVSHVCEQISVSVVE